MGLRERKLFEYEGAAFRKSKDFLIELVILLIFGGGGNRERRNRNFIYKFLIINILKNYLLSKLRARREAEGGRQILRTILRGSWDWIDKKIPGNV